ncbi:MAG: rhomboid family intramembrane serine protease [Pseudomonadota bacterium]
MKRTRRDKAWFRKPQKRRWPLAAVLLGVAMAATGVWQRASDWTFGPWSLIPAEFVAAFQGSVEWWQPPLITPLTSLFMHAGWPHLIGNLIYWALFAPRVESRIGALGFASLLLGCGVLANLYSVWLEPEGLAPLIGMSGMVSACMGAFLGLFPRSKVGVILPLGLYLQFLRIPAIALIGSWFGFQVLYTFFGDALGTVAWWTHIAGFVSGLILAIPLSFLTPAVAQRER